MRLTNKMRRSLVALGAAGLLTASIAGPVLAMDSTETETETETPAHEERFAERQAAFAKALAEELGLPEEQVQEALTTVREDLAEQWRAERQAAAKERLDAAVASGELTEEQADALREAAEVIREVAGDRDSGPPFGGLGGFRGPGGFRGFFGPHR